MLPSNVVPIPGIPVKPPRFPPQPGQVIVAYETEQGEAGCCKCDDLTTQGLVALIVLILVFPILAFIPCCSQDCHTKVQRPVYGFASQPGGYAQPPPMPTAAPVYK